MINLADKLTAKTVEGILADSNEIKYTKEMGDTSKAETVAKELSNLTDSMSGLSNSVTTLSQEFEIIKTVRSAILIEPSIPMIGTLTFSMISP